MRKASILIRLSIFLICFSPVFGQQRGSVRPNYKQAELYSPAFLRQRIYSTSVSPNWIGETDRFWYSYRTSAGTSYYLVDPSKAEKKPLFDHQVLAANLSIEVRKPQDGNGLQLSDAKLDDEGATFSFSLENTLFDLDLASGELTNKGEKPKAEGREQSRSGRSRSGRGQREEGEEEEEKDPRVHRNFSPDRTAYVFLQDFDLYYVEASDEVKQRVAEIDERMKRERAQEKAEAENQELVEDDKSDGGQVDSEEQGGKTDEQDGEQQEKDEVDREGDGSEHGDKDVQEHEKGGDEKGGDEKDGDEKDGDEKGGDEKGGDEKGGDEKDGDEKDGDEKGGDEKGGDEKGGDEKDEVDERERWADDVDETQALRLTDDGEEDYEFSGNRRSRRSSAFDDAEGEYDWNQYGWDELDTVERDRLLAFSDEKDGGEQDEKKKEKTDEKGDESTKDEVGEDDAEEVEAPEKTRPGVSWAPDSSAFHVTRSDSRDVAELFLVNSLAEPRPTLEKYRYPMPGEEKVTKRELYIFDRTRTELYKLPAKWQDEGYRNIHWGKLTEREVPDQEEDEDDEDEEEPKEQWKQTGDELRLQRRDRLLRNVELCSIDTRTGESTTLLEDGFEKGNISPQSVRYLEDRKNEMIWWSERSGWGHFYLYDWSGKFKNAITSGSFRASRIVEIDEEKGLLYFRGNAREAGENVYYEHLYRVYLDGTDLSILDPGDAYHRSSLSPTRNYVVDNLSRVDLAPRSILRDADGKELLLLEESDLSRLYETGWKMPETFSVKAADGVTDLYGNLWKPFDFDPGREYPIIAEVYPGPQTEGVSHTFSASNGRQQLAQIGFVVVQLGHRGGTPGRSKAYHTHGYFDLRDYSLADKKAGLEQLAARHEYIDLDRVGIYGHSGGGFLSAAALLREPYNDFFKVAVASSGNHDNNIYHQSWSERYHGLKQVEVKDEKKDEKKGEEDGRSEGQGSGKGSGEDGGDVGDKKEVEREQDVEEKKSDGKKKNDGKKEEEQKDDGKQDDGRGVTREKVDQRTESEQEVVVEQGGDGKTGEGVKEKRESDDGEELIDEQEKDEELGKKEQKDEEQEDEEQKAKVRFEIHVPTNAELAANLKGHLLLVHGEIDNNVHPAGTMRLVNALIKADKRFDMLILPGQRHGFGQFSQYFSRVRWEYFAEHLLDDYQTGVDISVRD